VEAVGAKVTDGAELAAVVGAAETVGGILDDRDAFLPGQLHQRLHVHRIATDMNGDDRFGARGDLPGHVHRVQVDRIALDVGEDDPGALA
jgi:hypothetical protein